MREKRRGKRFLAWALVLMMTLSLLPMSALAANGQELDEDESLHSAKIMSMDAHDNDSASGDDSENEGTPDYVAKIGEKSYETLNEAITEAEDGATVELLKDVTESITISKSLTLDLNGFTLTGADEESAVVTITGAETKPTITIKSSKLENEKPVNGTITGGKNPENGGGFAISNATVTLENLVITENQAGGTVSKGESGGGGIYAENANVVMQGVTVSKNEVTDSISDGGGILIKAGSLTMEGCTVKNNTAKDCGGGICLDHSALNTTNCFVEDNTANCGAGVYFCDSTGHAEENCTSEHEHLIIGSSISGNKLLNAEHSIGGGMYVGSVSSVTIRNSSVMKNGGADQGGAIVAYGARTIELDRVSAIENTAKSGAGIFIMGTAVGNTTLKLLNGTKIDSNEASGYGGGIYVYAVGGKANVTVENSSVSSNTAYGGAGIFTYTGADTAAINVSLLSGAVMHSNDATTGVGGAIYAYNKNATINVAEGSALYNNIAKQAGDDLFLNGATFTLPDAKSMSGSLVLSSDKEDITGWYHDGWCKWNPTANDGKGGYEEIGRWAADTADEYKPVANDSQAISLKAAHGQMFTVTYTDGVDGKEIFPDQVYKVEKGKTTPAFDGEVPTRSGYTFTGWSPAVAETVTADVTYTAQWRRNYRPNPPTPTVEIPDEDALGLNTDDHFAYIIGYPDGTVQPNGQITRAEATTIFFRLLTDESRENFWSTDNGYPDVNAGQWYNNAISTMTKAGIVDGYPDGTFRPDAPITRAEMAKIISLFAKLDKSESRFSDIAGHWAEHYIKLAAGNGWIEGYPDGTFGPQRNITRAETATMINRVLERVPSEESRLLSRDAMQIWPDSNPGDWFYLAMQEASNSHDYERNAKWAAADEQWTALRANRDWKMLEK